jgi:ABC-type glycerol-3-phosphate transport system permease component
MVQALGTSFVVALLVLAGTIAAAVPLAFALARQTPRRWRVVGAGLLLAGLFQATPALLVPLFALLSTLHLLDTVWGVVLPEIARAMPFAVLVLWAFLSATPAEVLEAAQVDGAVPLRQMVSIALPIARPALLAVAVWTFAGSWSEYLLPTLVSQDGSISTVSTLLGSFIGTYNTQLGPLAAGCLLAILPSLSIYLLLRRGAATGLSGIRGVVR